MMRWISKNRQSRILFLIVILTSGLYVSQTLALKIVKINYMASNNDKRFVEIYNDGAKISDFTGENYKLVDSKNPETKHSIKDFALGKGFEASSTIYITPSKNIPVQGVKTFRSSYSLDDDSGYLAITDKDGKIYSCLAYGKATCPDNFQDENHNETSEESSKDSTFNQAETKKVIKYIYVPENDQEKYGDIKVLIPESRTVLALADATYTIRAIDSHGKLVEDLDFNFSFGDGGAARGRTTRYHYTYPGEYLLVAEATGFTRGAKGEVKVKVMKPDIKIVKVGNGGEENYIELLNNTKEDLFLSDFYLELDGKYYQLPKNLLLGKNRMTKISGEALHFNLPATTTRLLYPDKQILDSYPKVATISTSTNLIVTTIKTNPQLTVKSTPETDNHQKMIESPKSKVVKSSSSQENSTNSEIKSFSQVKLKHNEQIILKRLILEDEKDIQIPKQTSSQDKGSKIVKKTDTVDIGLIRWFKNLVY